MASNVWGTSWGGTTGCWLASWALAEEPPAPPAAQVGGGGIIRAWNPLLELDKEEKKEIVAEARLVARESDTNAERKKAKDLARAVMAARTAREVVALQARIEWVRERAEELRREEEDEEMAIVFALLH